MDIRCLKCKGRGFCGRSFCPIVAKSQAGIRPRNSFDKEEFSAKSPAPFVGRVGYPNVNIGVLGSPIDNDDVLYDNPRAWASMGYDIPKIIEIRSSLINSRKKTHVKQNVVEISKEIAMAKKPVDVDVKLNKKPFFKINYDSTSAPTGPVADLKYAQITSNPAIPKAVEDSVNDTDFKASDALNFLYSKGFDETYLSRLLSVGILGEKEQRKIVPTRWSITATDDMLAKNLINSIKDFPKSEHLSFFGGYLGNYYLILFFPEAYSYELFEIYAPNAEWNVTHDMQFMTDYEPYEGRKSYAENCAGGFYAARLAIAEKLSEMKRQGSVLALRFITGEYALPLGVWVVREATRNSLKSKPIEFSSRELILRYAQVFAKRKFGMDITDLIRKSIMIGNIKTQKKLGDFS